MIDFSMGDSLREKEAIFFPYELFVIIDFEML